MRTLVLRIPDDLEARLEALASRLGKTKSAIARELLSKGVRSRRKDDLSAFDLIRDQIGIVDTGIGDLASNPKHMQRFGR
jgi:predicted DNA-binding protein